MKLKKYSGILKYSYDGNQEFRNQISAFYNNHQGMPTAQLPLILSHHLSLSVIALGKFSKQLQVNFLQATRSICLREF